MNDLVIFGTGGFAREVHQVVEDINKQAFTWRFRGFLDSEPARHGQELHGYPVLGGGEWLAAHPGVAVAVAIGSPAARWRVAESLGSPKWATLVHPRAWIGNRVALGEGVIVCAGTLVTTDLTIGRHVILNLDCTVGHDAQLGDFVTAAPSVNISGNVRVGPGCDLGTGSNVIQDVAIGGWSIVGAGAVVVRDLPANVTAVGIPARVISQRQEGWYRA
ncbi:MAG: acetyltransferase [bacterium]|nr:acetyltransferase [bacterium]